MSAARHGRQWYPLYVLPWWGFVECRANPGKIALLLWKQVEQKLSVCPVVEAEHALSSDELNLLK